MKRSEVIQTIVERAEMPMPRIAEVRQFKGSDGRFYGPIGFPSGVTPVGESIVAGYCWLTADGTHYGIQAGSREELIDRWQAARDQKNAEFSSTLAQMSDKRLHEQWRFWMHSEPPTEIESG